MKLGRAWRKSSLSGGDSNCVEARRAGDGVEIRDSKNPTGPALPFAADAWNAFLQDVKVGNLDPQNHI